MNLHELQPLKTTVITKLFYLCLFISIVKDWTEDTERETYVKRKQYQTEYGVIFLIGGLMKKRLTFHSKLLSLLLLLSICIVLE